MTLRTYKEISLDVDSYNTTKANFFGICVISVFISLLIISAPLVILINLLIFNEYRHLIYLGFGLLLTLLITFIELFINIGITEGKVKDVWVLSLTHAIFISLFINIILVILFSLGVL